MGWGQGGHGGSEHSKKNRGVRLGGQGGCEQRSEVIVKIKKKIGGGVRRIRLGGQGGCE